MFDHGRQFRDPLGLLPRIEQTLNTTIRPTFRAGRRLAAMVADAFPRLEHILYPPEMIHHERQQGGCAALTVAGRGQASAFLLERIGLGVDALISVQGRRRLWRLARDTSGDDVTAALIEADCFYHRFLVSRGYAAVPTWVNFYLDLSTPWSELLTRWKRRIPDNLRRVHKYCWTFRLSRDPRDLRTFYRQMYLPYIKLRHGASAILTSQGLMDRVLLQGQLLFVRRNGQDVAGFLIATEQRDPKVFFVGVRDADFTEVKLGAVTALYLYTAQWAHQRGHREVDFGYTRPFLDDGLFRFKKSWGMRVRASRTTPRVIYVLAGADSRLDEALSQALVLVDGGAGLAAFAPENASVLQAMLDTRAATHSNIGLGRLPVK